MITGWAARAALALLLASFSFAVLAQRNLEVAPGSRVALVIGNGAYKDAPLTNPVNDAVDVAKALQESGFKVILRRNAGTREIRQAIREFGAELRRAEVGLFYFAGHGIQVRGNNYLLPIGADIHSEADVEDLAIDAAYALRTMEEAQVKVSIAILDACRNNPFSRGFRSASRGLAQMNAATGSVIAFATAPGSVAADGTGRNGVYTKHFLASLTQGDTDILKVFQRTRAGVVRETAGKQTPWESTSLIGDFYFKPARAGQQQVAISVPAAPAVGTAATIAINSPTFLDDLEGYLRQSASALTDLRAAAGRGDNLARARLCAAATHERYNLGLRPEDGIDHCRELAAAGVPVGMFLLARSHQYGRGIAKSDQEAVRWYRDAAERGNASAMANLGYMYDVGAGVRNDDAEAVRWYRLAAEAGNPLAMENLGLFYKAGRGGARDDAEAVRWYRAAAERGYTRSMALLGLSYERGEGVDRDVEQAVTLYRSAAQAGEGLAIERLKSLGR